MFGPRKRGLRGRHETRSDLLFTAVLLAGYAAVELAGLPRRWPLVGLALALLLYGGLVVARRPRGWHELGLRADNLGRCAAPIGTVTALGALGILAWAAATGRSPWRADLAILLPLYPLYGVAQQTVFQGLLHRRLLGLLRSRPLAAVLTTLAFALVHLGDARLLVLAAVAGAAWSLLYQRWPHLWLLGLSHGILAALAYPLLLGDAPLGRL